MDTPAFPRIILIPPVVNSVINQHYHVTKKVLRHLKDLILLTRKDELMIT